MPNINWDESNPENTDSAGDGATEIRSLKTALRTGLDSEHNWPSGGVDAGYHRLGSARAYHGTQSRVSSSGTDGRLMVASDTSRMFHVGSVATSLVGGPTVISAGSYPGGAAPQRHYWAMEFGTGKTGSAATNINFPSAFSGVPFVTVTPAHNNSTGSVVFMVVFEKDDTQFTVASYLTTGVNASNITFDWMSIGTRVL